MQISAPNENMYCSLPMRLIPLDFLFVVMFVALHCMFKCAWTLPSWATQHPSIDRSTNNNATIINKTILFVFA